MAGRNGTAELTNDTITTWNFVNEPKREPEPALDHVSSWRIFSGCQANLSTDDKPVAKAGAAANPMDLNLTPFVDSTSNSKSVNDFTVFDI